jgi:hypothetical protein
MFTLPGFLLFEMISPLVELSGYLLLPLLWVDGILSLSLASSFFVVSVMYLALISALAVLLEELALRRHSRIRDLARLLLVAVLENFGVRQLTLWWRVKALAEYLRGDLSWSAMERRGMVGTA